MASIQLQGDNSGSLTIQAPSDAGNNTLTLPATSSTLATQNALGVRNLIINGDMRIDQRYGGVPIAMGTYQYMVDRWWFYGSQSGKFSAQQNLDSITPPEDFKNYLGLNVDSAYTVGTSDQFIVATRLEGLNTAHLKWGTANAKTITVSYYVRSSLSGTFSGYIRNSAANRSYPFTYTIDSANTWEKKTITISGDTTGTWLETNGTGIELGFNLGSGSSVSGTANTWAAANYTGATGATSIVETGSAKFYFTGVQLEVGDTATPFEHRPYDMELQRCMRYYEIANLQWYLGVYGNDFRGGNTPHRVIKRAIPTGNIKSGTIRWALPGVLTVSAESNTGVNIVEVSNYSWFISHARQAGGGSPTNGYGYMVETDVFIDFDAEL